MRGISGSGKSTRAKQIAQERGGAVICSADNYFLDEDGNYNFDVRKLSAAHNDCRLKFEKAVQWGEPTVIIDNTNTRKSEYKHYIQYASAQGYDIQIVKIDPPSIKECADRNVHGVPEDVIKKQLKRFE